MSVRSEHLASGRRIPRSCTLDVLQRALDLQPRSPHRARCCSIWQTVVVVDEGVIAVPGVYLVKYFIGGSGCAVAESQRFKVNWKDYGGMKQTRSGGGVTDETG